MTDKLLRQDVIDELNFVPNVDAADIGVAVSNGVVTLTGHVNNYAQKLGAERAVRQVKGVRAIAEEIEVRYPNDKKTADDQIAERALAILNWDAQIPAESIMVRVERGWVTLTGEVNWQYQRLAAEKGRSQTLRRGRRHKRYLREAESHIAGRARQNPRCAQAQRRTRRQLDHGRRA
jgi:osmotically-inducible protein OsmY